MSVNDPGREVVTVETKKWYESKTIIINLAVTLLTVGIFVAEGLLEGELDVPLETDAGMVALVITLLNILLRIVTKQPVEK